MKKKKIHRKTFLKYFALVAGGVLIMLGLLFVAATYRMLKDDPAWHVSDEYQFKWNWFLGHAKVLHQGEEIASFSFRPRPFRVFVHGPTKRIAIITTDNGLKDGAEGVYVFDGSRLEKVFQARRVKLSEDAVSSSNVGALTFSPDGRYLFLGEYGYEGGAGFVVDLATYAQLDPFTQPSLFGQLFWSPDGSCVFNEGYAYGDYGYLQLGKLSNNGYQLWEKEKTHEATGLGNVSVYWDRQGNCSGIVGFDELEILDETATSETVSSWYAFSYDGGMQKLSAPPSVDAYLSSKDRSDVVKVYEVTEKK